LRIGLRIDVDTFRGTRDGVPSLCSALAAHGILATLFFSVGPDNMGRNLWRLFRPTFLKKMLRTKAASLYGWDILLMGTFWPGPMIGAKLAPVIKAASDAGHELGFHAWDHHAWQTRIERENAGSICGGIEKGTALLRQATGRPAVCAAAPSWKCTDRVLLEKLKFDFTFNSDCRGRSIFYPVVDGRPLPQPQIPTTLPTYDEVVGQSGILEHNYNDYILGQLKPEGLNVLTIHAEVEGIMCRQLFDDFIRKAQARQCTFVTLGTLLQECDAIGRGCVVQEAIPGRDGWVSVQR